MATRGNRGNGCYGSMEDGVNSSPWNEERERNIFGGEGLAWRMEVESSPSLTNKDDNLPESRVEARTPQLVAMTFTLGWAFLALWIAFSTSRVEFTPAHTNTNSLAEESSLSNNLLTTQHVPTGSLSMPGVTHDPAQPLFFDQVIDHNQGPSSGIFPQRYYENKNYWQGPGHPIFLIFGGEGPLERILYPFISEIIAQRFGAVTLNPEHRYFGVSFPVTNFTREDIAEQLTPRQAIQDAMALIQAKQTELGCGPRGSPTYCPVMAVGGSYAGLLATLARKTYPQVFDIGYAASPCLLLFDHQISPYHYYETITQVAERVSPGCPSAVRSSISYIQKDWNPISETDTDQLRAKAAEYGLCPDSLPPNVTGATFALSIIGYTSANFGGTLMDYYPPTPEQVFAQGCQIFQNLNNSVPGKVRKYIRLVSDSSDCYSLQSNDEDDDDPDLWGALTCYLVPMIGKSEQSMWPVHKYSLENEIDFCQRNFGIRLDVDYLDKEFGLNDLSNVTRLLLTNGRNDGWFPLSYTDAVPGNPNIAVFTMENGAHHSDLTHQLQVDTPDVVYIHSQISDLVASWLGDVTHEGSSH